MTAATSHLTDRDTIGEPLNQRPPRAPAEPRDTRSRDSHVKRLPLAVEPQALPRDVRPVLSTDCASPYGTRPTADLVTSAEDHYLEHKQTLRYDVHTKQANPKLEDSVMDRVCGFWNADGGTLIIGVEDRTGLVTGLGPDLKLVSDLDALVNHLS